MELECPGEGADHGGDHPGVSFVSEEPVCTMAGGAECINLCGGEESCGRRCGKRGEDGVDDVGGAEPRVGGRVEGLDAIQLERCRDADDCTAGKTDGD